MQMKTYYTMPTTLKKDEHKLSKNPPCNRDKMCDFPIDPSYQSKKNTFDYILKTKDNDGVLEYYVGFKDAQKVYRETKVSYIVYKELKEFEKYEGRMSRRDKRRLEHAELTDEELYTRAFQKSKTVIELISDESQRKSIDLAISKFTEVQDRRFLQYYNTQMTLQQIADLEGCSPKAVSDSLKLAETKIFEALKEDNYI